MEEAKSSGETDLFNTGLNSVNHSCLKVCVGCGWLVVEEAPNI